MFPLLSLVITMVIREAFCQPNNGIVHVLATTSCFGGSKDRGRHAHYPGIAMFYYERQAISGHNLQYSFSHFA